MIVGARQAGLSISITGDLGFSCTTFSIVYSEWCNKEKNPVCSGSVDGRDLLMRELNGEWPKNWFELTEWLQVLK